MINISYKPILTFVSGFTDSISCCFTVNVLFSSSFSLIASYPFRDCILISLALLFRFFNHGNFFIE